MELNEKLIKATIHNDLEFIKTLREFHPELHWKNARHPKTGETVLHFAANSGNLNLLKYFLTSYEVPSGLIDSKSNDGSTPLHVASQQSKPSIVKYLLFKNADVNALRRGDWTPLAVACTKSGPNAKKCVLKLLKHNASTKFANKDGWTPLMVACRTGDAEIVRVLLNKDAKAVELFSKNQRLPLHVACYHGHKEIAELLVAAKSEFVNKKDSCGTTPFLDAVFSGNVDLVKFLAGLGQAEVKVVNNEGWNALHVACGVGKREMVEFLVKELRFGVNERTLDKRKLTPLHCAARAKAFDCIELLLEVGADLEVLDWNQRSFRDYLEHFKS